MKLFTIDLAVAGLGFILYAPESVRHIRTGSNYLEEHFLTPEQVTDHLREGSIAGIATGSPGDFEVSVFLGSKFPADTAFDFSARAALRVPGDRVCIRDLYDLMDWDPDCPTSQVFTCPTGLYELHLVSKRPASGLIGDHQSVCVLFVPMDAQPEFDSESIPTLYVAGN